MDEMRVKARIAFDGLGQRFGVSGLVKRAFEHEHADVVLGKTFLLIDEMRLGERIQRQALGVSAIRRF
ncbi:MAG: hypothetical protein M5R36_28245 [Deltaproteobacteria bacterium]|nr:hypothetical protein [Deltaproteobacteria bacterium]